MPPFGPLGLAADAAGRVGTGVEPTLGYLVAAVDALPVGAVVDAGERGEHFVALAASGVEDRLGAVGLGENGPGVGRILRIARARTGPGRSPCRTAIERSKSSRISSRRLRATLVSTGVLASRPRTLGSPGSH